MVRPRFAPDPNTNSADTLHSEPTDGESELAKSRPRQREPAERPGNTARHTCKSTMALPKYHSIARVAVRWQVSERTVRRMIADGEVRAVKIRGQLRISERELQEYEAIHLR